eukprot:349763-Chlamydomonas_euryale.AAC.4
MRRQPASTCASAASSCASGLWLWQLHVQALCSQRCLHLGTKPLSLVTAVQVALRLGAGNTALSAWACADGEQVDAQAGQGGEEGGGGGSRVAVSVGVGGWVGG